MSSFSMLSKNLFRQIPNGLSITRLLLSFCFLSHDPIVRMGAVAGAVITDVLDGFLARNFCGSSRFGTLLDPLADKVFVLAALLTFLNESSLSWGEVLSMLSRDMSLLAFSLYLLLKGKWGSYQIRAFIMGKVCTTMQFAALFFAALQKSLPFSFFSLLFVFGFLGFFELLFREKPKMLESES